MRPGDLPRRGLRFVRMVRQLGVTEATRQAALRLLLRPTDMVPFARANPAGLFATDTDEIHAEERRRIRAGSLLTDASQVEATYPEVFEIDGRFMRYAFLPAAEEPRGLVVLFHGHDAYLHLGPVRPWRRFNVLAPWDTFGWRRRGSWFWGEGSTLFVSGASG